MPPRFRISLSVSIQSIFFSVALTLAALLTWYNYQKNFETALVLAENLMREVNGAILRDMDTIYAPVRTLGNTLPLAPEVATKPDAAHRHPLSEAFLAALDSNEHIYGFFLGWDDGEFYQAIHILDPAVSSALRAPEGARYALRHVNPGPFGSTTQTWTFLDAARAPLAQRNETTAFDPRSRPWYKLARPRAELMKTKLYIFASTRNLGTTVAHSFQGPVGGVLGIDITLGGVSQFLDRYRLGERGQVFTFAADGQITGHRFPGKVVRRITDRQGKTWNLPARVSDLNDPVIQGVYDQYVSGADMQNGVKAFSVDGQRFLSMLTPLGGGLGSHEFVAVVAPEEHFVAPLIRVRDHLLLFSLVVLLASMPIIVLVAQRIARPLNLMAAEAERIKRFDLESTLHLRSHIIEVDNLSTSMSRMKGALRSFGQYIPRDLVRRLVESGAEPRLGGDRRELTLLFTDIADFTTLSDTMAPETLMELLSNYFHILGDTISGSGGTIDKFIGDSVMAFWNAPTRAPDHTALACLAALRGAAALSGHCVPGADDCRMLATRFGLHRGEAVVGNIGSSDRLNYTAMGSAVNVAARLEGMNKFYGTTILASQAVVDAAGDDFVFRAVDVALPKGALTPVTIHELLGTRPGGPHPELAVAPAELERLHTWHQAYADYRARHWARAHETLRALHEAAPSRLTRVYLERAARAMAQNPGPDWTGIEEFHTK
ncbi:adenylate/guanylate cyclase domain-containing protein [Desulfocurvus vexinensis]|uniref:adenylate/guanylate cyclase domain-containing protein n=1 Tax=Desulfocurvus vexinensis TaxID=399548 RepID=UPI00048F2CE3|nr:adenylate/guanylate cyclase domain-containing protein [Desulfocurvus vexinensis]